MQITFHNCPKPSEFQVELLPKERPAFLSYVPNFEAIKKIAREYSQYKNLLIVGHGGSITSFQALYGALESTSTKKVYFLSTIDPDYIYALKQQVSKEDSLVIAISKSGQTVTQIEALSQFADFPTVYITSSGSTLAKMAEQLEARIVPHPNIGGRYAGMTEVALIPAALCGFNVEGLYAGAEELYAAYDQTNLAWDAATVFEALERAGYVDVFMPYYSHELFATSPLVVQLCHESFGKGGVGQTYVAFEAPESQHHSNQRFFGGMRNMAGLFIGLENFLHNAPTHIPSALLNVSLKGQALSLLADIPLGTAMRYELEGTIEDAKIHGIPVAHLSVYENTAKEIGTVMAFWQLYAVYGALVRKVDPFDQPQIENSKAISLTKRLSYKGIL